MDGFRCCNIYSDKFLSKGKKVDLFFQSAFCNHVSNILRAIYNTEMVAQGFSVDLNKPLVFQVGHLGEDYEDWVHRPIVTKEIPRFFANGFMEWLTRTVWWVVPVIWLPVVFWCLIMSIGMGNTLPQLVPMVLSGILLWTLIEYSLHRFLFHMKTKGYWGNTIHYLFHGCHHKYPMDGLRLVFPPAATAIICVPFWHLLHLLMAPSAVPAVFGGGLLGYVIYDCTHYYLHHGHPSKHPAKHLKINHEELFAIGAISENEASALFGRRLTKWSSDKRNEL
ncbi:fatty acid [Musa troglodytarum]|uniref:Fatty acid n=1 Tax=Musa troglodytarum TaxID=320322 RepID=A0A9E7JSY9_9LILI|nr:fatty acid [Musa troglodytarum]